MNTGEIFRRQEVTGQSASAEADSVRLKIAEGSEKRK